MTQIVSCEPATRNEWMHTGAGQSCTWFHTCHWADIFCKATKGRMVAVPRKLRFSDGAEALIPLVRRSFFGGALSLDWSMPAWTYGGWVPAPELTIEHIRAVVSHLGSLRDVVWRENPCDPFAGKLDIPGSRDDFTQVIDLRDGFAAAEDRFDYAHRKAVRKAAASGVTVAEASRYDEWMSYFSLYGASRERWKAKNTLRTRGFDSALFRAIYESPAAHRKLWLARVDGACAAGIICFYWNTHAVAWHGAGDEKYFGCRPNNLLYEHAIRHAAETGHAWFDCNPSGGLEGVIRFKEHLGAKRLSSRVIERRSVTRSAAELAGRILRGL